MKKRPYIVAITGASGVAYGVRLVEVLANLELPVALIVSEKARIVIREELGITTHSYNRAQDFIPLLSDQTASRVEVYSPKDLTAPVASGSYPVSGMVIIPCSMGTLGAVAQGLSQNLVHRAADCVIKEGRRLVMVPRETPLSAIHLENMLKLARLGVRMVPAMPAFYSGAQTIADLTDFLVGKVLDQLEIEHTLYPRWTGLAPKSERG